MAPGVLVYTKTLIRSFSVTADGTTDDAPQINAALTLAMATGGTVILPPLTVAVASSLVVPPGVSLLGQSGARTDLGTASAATQCSIKALASFSGIAVISVLDKEVGGYSSDNSGVTIKDLNIDSSLIVSGSVDGIQVKGKCDGLRIENVSIYKARTNGVSFQQYVRLDTLTYKTINAVLARVVSHTSGALGFSFVGNTDCEISDCYSLGAGDDGFQFSTSCANTRLSNCRSEGSANYGYHITGAWNNGTGAGGMQLIGCSTDRNTKSGIRVDATSGTGPISITSPMLRRDGRNAGSGGGNFAGLDISAATVPVIVAAPTVYCGVEDNGTGTNSPQIGVSITSTCTYVAVTGGGHLHAQVTPWSDDGTSTVLRGPGISERIGSTSSPGSITVDEWQRHEWTAEELGYIEYNYDPQLMSTTSALVSGTIQLVRLKLRRARVITNIEVFVNQAGTTITAGTSFAGLYSISGGTATKMLVTADQSAAWASTGIKTMALASGPILAPIGDYIVPLVSTFSGTAVGFGRMSRLANAQLLNGKLSATNARFATNGTGTTLPTTFTLSSNATSAEDIWVGLS